MTARHVCIEEDEHGDARDKPNPGTINRQQSRFSALLRDLYPQLHRYARWRCGDSASADDLVQETLLRAWRSVDGLRDETAVRAWVFTICRHELARRYGRETEPVLNIDELTETDAPRIESDGAREIAVHDALARMDRKYQEPLIMKVITGLNCREIGRALGISETAVMSRLFRARRQMRDLL